ncbi:MAG: hypothetical protein VKJ27_05275 [Synechocystis sp.]|nr:hypothetical protein [Synechocystis sp.]
MTKNFNNYSESTKSEFKQIPGMGTAHYHVQAKSIGGDNPETVTSGTIEEQITPNGRHISVSCSASASSSKKS